MFYLTMRILILILFFLTFNSYNAMSKNKCNSSDDLWNNCYGFYKYDNGDSHDCFISGASIPCNLYLTLLMLIVSPSTILI